MVGPTVYKCYTNVLCLLGNVFVNHLSTKGHNNRVIVSNSFYEHQNFQMFGRKLNKYVAVARHNLQVGKQINFITEQDQLDYPLKC